MVDDERTQKWDRRYQQTAATPVALEVLVDNSHLLPAAGSALDLACGLGGSGLLLAERGLITRAWDLSPVAIDALNTRAGDLPLIAEVRDVVRQPPPPESYDVICVGHFLDREICPEISTPGRSTPADRNILPAMPAPPGAPGDRATSKPCARRR